MAKKISAFEELIDLSASDYLPIIDDSEMQANMNKRVTVSTLDSRYILSNVTEDTSSVTISGNIVPSKNNTYSIGLENRQYKNLFVKDISVSSNLSAQNATFGGLINASAISGEILTPIQPHITTLPSLTTLPNVTNIGQTSRTVTFAGNITCSMMYLSQMYATGYTELKNLDVTNDASFHENLYVENNLTVTDVSVSNNLDVLGDVSIAGNLTTSTFNVAGNTSLSDLSVNGILDVSGLTRFKHGKVIASKISVTDLSVDNLDVVCNLNVSGDIYMNNTGILYGPSVNIACDGFECVSSEITGNTQLYTLAVTDVSVSNKLDVLGDVSIAGNLTTSAFNVANTLEATDVSVGRNLFINLSTLPTSYDSNYPNRVWLSEDFGGSGTGFLRIGIISIQSLS
jgi:hypothetical protein